MNVLFISANCADAYMDIEREQRTLQQLTASREHSVHVLPATEIGDLQDTLRAGRFSKKFDVLHFSGHATDEGLHLRGKGRKKALLDTASLKEMLKNSGIQLVVLNACASETIATSLGEVVPDVIGTSRKVRDVVARQFTRLFYTALMNGATVAEALSAALREQRTSVSPAYIHATGNTNNHKHDGDYQDGQQQVYV